MKLEDNIKERLEERRIEPTAAAWDRISDKLETANGKKNNTFLLWTAIAASFIGGVFITLFVLNGQRSETPEFVETPVQEKIQEVNKTAPIEAPVIAIPSQEEQIVAVPEVEERKKENITQKSTEVQIQKERRIQKPQTVNKVNEAVAAVTTPKVQENVAQNTQNPVFQDPLEKAVQKEVASIVAQINTETVSDAEIDALLLKAQRDIISKDIFNPETNKVDANALLLDVESEVDPASFKGKIYDALKDGFIKARDAVADRNN